MRRAGSAGSSGCLFQAHVLFSEAMSLLPTCSQCHGTSGKSICLALIHCDFGDKGCAQIVKLSDLRQHAEGCCFRHQAATGTQHLPAPSQAELPPATQPPAAQRMVAELLGAPINREVLSNEQKLLTGLLRRLSHTHQAQVGLPLHTGGRPAHVSFTPAGSATEPRGRRERQDLS